MKRLAGLILMSLTLLILGASTASSSGPPFVTYLPAVENWIATPTPTPTPSMTPTVTLTATSVPGVMNWTDRAPYPWNYGQVVGGVAIGGQLFVFGTNRTFDYGDGSMHALTYDSAADSWTARPGKTLGPICCIPMLVAGPVNGKAYIFANDYTSGPMTLEYDPTTDSWATKAPIPIPIGTFLYGYVAGSDGKIYAIGRLPDPSNPSAYSSTVRVFDPAQNTWSVAAPLPSTSNWPSVAATSDGRIYAFDEGVVNVYTISTNSWTTTSSNAVIYGQMGAVQAGNGKIYLVGGPILASNLGFPLKLVTVYDPKTNTWEQQTELPRGAQGPSLVALNGDDLYVIGGWAGSSWNDSVQEAKIP